MYKRNFSALVLSLVGLFLLILPWASANPYQETESVPPDASTFPSKITVLAPSNGSVISSTNTSLTVNVTLPQSTTASNTVIWSIICQPDWQNEPITIYQNSGYENSIDKLHPKAANHFFYGTINLTQIPQGQHTLTVTVISGGFYLHPPTYSRFSINSSETTQFFNDLPQLSSTANQEINEDNNNQNPLTLIMMGLTLIVALAVGIGLFLKKKAFSPSRKKLV